MSFTKIPSSLMVARCSQTLSCSSGTYNQSTSVLRSSANAAQSLPRHFLNPNSSARYSLCLVLGSKRSFSTSIQACSSFGPCLGPSSMQLCSADQMRTLLQEFLRLLLPTYGSLALRVLRPVAPSALTVVGFRQNKRSRHAHADSDSLFASLQFSSALPFRLFTG